MSTQIMNNLSFCRPISDDNFYQDETDKRQKKFRAGQNNKGEFREQLSKGLKIPVWIGE